MIEGSHYNGASTTKSVLLNCLTIIGKRSHFGHFMLDFLWPLYHWLYVHGRLYDRDLKIYTTDTSIEKFRSVIDEFFHCKVVTKFDGRAVVGCYTDIILGMEGHNRKVFKLTVEAFIGNPKEYIVHMQEYAFEKMGITPCEADRLILVERKVVDEDRGGGRRNIANHSQLEKALEVFAEMKGLTFQNAVLEDMSFIEQVKLFSTAKVVVGQHGAGLCHFLWMPKGGFLQELHHNHGEAYRFGEFCCSFGFGHNNMMCPKDEDKSIEVPINDLVAKLDKEIGEKV